MLRLRLTGAPDAVLHSVAHSIRAGGVAVIPTDTLYGFSARYDRPSPIRRIAALKGRESASPFLLLIGDLAQLARLTPAPPPAAVLAEVWPGPVTLLLAADPGLLPLLRGPAGTVAVRFPRDERLRALLDAVGVPVVSTSVNRHGDTPLSDPARIAADFAQGIDVLADDGPRTAGVPSTIVDLTRHPPVVVRAGAVAVDVARLTRLLGGDPPAHDTLGGES